VDQKIPAGRSHSIAVLGSQIYLFGGFDGTDNTNTLIRFDTVTMTWEKPHVRGDIPSPRSFHTLSAVGKKLYLYGGSSNHPEDRSPELRDMFCLDTEDPNRLRWSQIQYTDAAPAGRYEHSASVIGNKIFIFGGGNSTGWLNETLIFDTEKNKWLTPRPSGKKPTQRLAHSSCVVGNNLWIIGGYSSSARRLNDLHILNTSQLVWSQPRYSGSLRERAGHTSVLIDSLVLVFGGYDNHEMKLNDISLINTQNFEVINPLVRGTSPSPRSYHAVACVGRRMFVFGGFDGSTVLDDIWYLELDYVGDATKEIVVPPSTLSTDLGQGVNNPEFSDVQFQMDDGTILYAHKIILVTRSNHFRAMFTHGLKESNQEKVEIKGVSPHAFLLLLYYIYTGSVKLLPTLVAELLEIADLFGEDRLKLIVQKYMGSHLDNQNVSDCFMLADRFNAKELRKIALNHILVNYDFVSQEPNFHSLPAALKHDVQSILQYNKLLKDSE